MKVLVTGAGGYIGACLVPALRARGHEVTGLDAGYYEDGWLGPADSRPAAGRRRDVRDVQEADLRGLDAVVHLAELSNDPLGELAPEVTYEINYGGSVRLARRARAAGVRRFVYSSSCSVYGAAGDGVMTETSPTRPQTAYARCKLLVEAELARLAGEDFSPVILRNATAFGASPRMRFDVVLNNLAGAAWALREIRVQSDGTPWRPLVHVLDICEAIACALEAPREAVHAQIFNVGADEQNYRVREIAALVAEAFPGCALTFGPGNGDTRSYRVCFAKARAALPGFRCRRDAAAGARELRALFEALALPPAMVEFRAFTRLRQLRHLLASGQLDERFRWRTADVVAA